MTTPAQPHLTPSSPEALAAAAELRRWSSQVARSSPLGPQGAEARDLARAMKGRAEELDRRDADRVSRKARAASPHAHTKSCPGGCPCICHDIGSTAEHGDLGFCPGKLIDEDLRQQCFAAASWAP